MLSAARTKMQVSILHFSKCVGYIKKVVKNVLVEC